MPARRGRTGSLPAASAVWRHRPRCCSRWASEEECDSGVTPGTELARAGGVNNNLARFAGGRTHVKPRNPLVDPLAHLKEPLSRARRGKPKIEFSPTDIRDIRLKFGATQKQFAALVGINVETLRNWEKGRRHPHGPARALLRAIDADPFILARLLNWHAEEFQAEPEDWLDV